jgi:predicted amidohydrolase
MNTTIRDNRGRVVAHLKDEGDGVRLYDAQHHTLGHYSRTRDVTMDARYRPIGRGNQLQRLVPAR